jgi:hypothetical protein
MNSSDLIALAAVAIPTVGGIVAWLWRHSTRLTGAEVRIENLAANADAAQRRTDGQFAQIMASLARLEDKMDRKADRP